MSRTLQAASFAVVSLAIAAPALRSGDERAAQALSAFAQGRDPADPVWIDVVRLDLTIRPWQADYPRARAEIEAHR